MSGTVLPLTLLNKTMNADFFLLLPVFPEEDVVGISFSYLVPQVGGMQGGENMSAVVMAGISEAELRAGLGQLPCFI